MSSSESTRKSRAVSGIVVSNKMQKTIVVKVSRRVKNTLGKYIYRSTKMHAHDEENVCQIGDEVLIEQSKPMAKHKSWRLVSVVSSDNKS